MKSGCCSGGDSVNPGQMMENMMDGTTNPMMDMCKGMMESINNTAKMAGFATSEVRALFEEWAHEVEGEILSIIKQQGQVNPLEIANELKISEDSALYFISKLLREKKIKILSVLFKITAPIL